MDDDDAVFKALADPTRRRLLDHLFEHDGARLTDLEALVEMTRFGVMKHLQRARGRRARGDAALRPREAAPPERRADPPHPRPMDRQVPGRAGRVPRRSQERTGEGVMSNATQVYHVFIRATADDIWRGHHEPRTHRAVLLRNARSRSRPRRSPRADPTARSRAPTPCSSSIRPRDSCTSGDPSTTPNSPASQRAG